MLLDETLPFCSILDRRSGASYSGNLQWPGCRYLRRFKREAQVCSHQPGELSGVEKIELELAQIARNRLPETTTAWSPQLVYMASQMGSVEADVLENKL